MLDIVVRIISFEFVFGRKSSKGIDDVSALIGVDVLGREFCNTRSVCCPIGIVAHQLEVVVAFVDSIR